MDKNYPNAFKVVFISLFWPDTRTYLPPRMQTHSLSRRENIKHHSLCLALSGNLLRKEKERENGR